MPFRKTPLVTGEVYHVVNRGIDNRPTFTDKREKDRAIKVINYYHYKFPDPKFSRFLTLNEEDQQAALEKMILGEENVEVLCYCLMTNHFHFLVKQASDNGISKFISQFLNSCTRYFNTKHDRIGPLFLDQFKAVLVSDDEQLTHVSRYIHLNPYTSFMVGSLDGLIDYSWSSFRQYLGLEENFCETSLVLELFSKKRAVATEKYKKFVFDQADYQRELDKIKHLTME